MDKKEVKKEIEDENFWYFVKCQTCERSFLVEESMDKNPKLSPEGPLTFRCHCPRCKTENIHVATTDRLRLSVVRFVRRGEFDPLTRRLAKKIRIEGFDAEMEKKKRLQLQEIISARS